MLSDPPNSIMIRCACFSHNISNIRPEPATFFPNIVPKDRFITYWNHDVIPSGDMTTGTNVPYSGQTGLTSCQTCLHNIINKRTQIICMRPSGRGDISTQQTVYWQLNVAQVRLHSSSVCRNVIISCLAPCWSYYPLWTHG